MTYSKHFGSWFKRGLFGLLLVLGIWGVHPTQAQTTRDSIAFADYEQIFTNFFKTKLANDRLQEMADSINRERSKMIFQFELMQKDFADFRTRLTSEELSDEDRDDVRKKMDAVLVEMQKMEERIRLFNEAQVKRWDEQNRRIRKSLNTEIQGKMTGFMKARGYLAVIDRSLVNEQGIPAVIYLDPKADVTQELIAEINK